MTTHFIDRRFPIDCNAIILVPVCNHFIFILNFIFVRSTHLWAIRNRKQRTKTKNYSNWKLTWTRSYRNCTCWCIKVIWSLIDRTRSEMILLSFLFLLFYVLSVFIWLCVYSNTHTHTHKHKTQWVFTIYRNPNSVPRSQNVCCSCCFSLCYWCSVAVCTKANNNKAHRCVSVEKEAECRAFFS